MRFLAAFVALFLFLNSSSGQYDWPMWRFDAGRTANTPEKLPEKLYLQWQLKLGARTPVWDDPLNQNLMQFDRLFEPIIVDNKLFIGFNDQDKVAAYDLATGKEVWHYFADGPVRLPLAANNHKIYFTSDDGFCYSLDAKNGRLIWKKLLAPASNKLLGNKRMISMWPARGGIVIKDNIIYTAASIFPLMGTFIYALDAETGNVIWKNEGSSQNYILQPHRSPAFADVAPQGTFALSGNVLLVAGGRSVPAAFDIKTGEELYYELAGSGKTGGWFTCASDKVFFNHFRERKTFMFDSKNGKILKQDAGEYPVVDGNLFYFSGKAISASSLSGKLALDEKWKSDFSATHELIKAGDCLYAADSLTLSAISLKGEKPQRLWSIKTPETVERLIAGNGKLIAVTATGNIMVFGGEPVKKVQVIASKILPMKAKSVAAGTILAGSSVMEGYAAVFGTSDIDLLKKLVLGTSLNIVAFEKDPERVSFLREYFSKAGITANRLSFLQYTPGNPLLPKYFASLMVVTDPFYLNDSGKNIVAELYESVRPYGGEMWLMNSSTAPEQIQKTRGLYGAVVSEEAGFTKVTRSGALEGTASWTHNYGDIANTIKSDDKMVKAPLGILWFGGNSNLDVLPRHGHGPSEQVIDGRMIIEGINTISARDVYTGRLLWKRTYENMKDDSWLVYFDETYDGESPLETKYNQEHLPGANSRGTNFIATKEYVYLIEGNKCHLIDINSGKEVKTFTSGDSATRKFAYIGVYKDYLLLGNNFTDYAEVEKASDEKVNEKYEKYDFSASNEILVMDRFTGEKKWTITANNGFIHNSIIAGDDMLFCLDKLPQNLETRLRRRGEKLPEGSRLLYIDINSGKIIHQQTENVYGTWLGYSEEYKLLLQATRPSRDMLNGEEGKRMTVYKVGTREVLWDKPVKYSNPPILANDKIYTEGEGFYLLTGDPIMEKDPLTGEDLLWKYKREYGCGYVIASEHLLTFRSAAAGFVNLDVFEGTGNLGGFKAGCSANLVVADGVLNAPDYTRTCQCPYQNQTSLAFVYMPWMNYWTNSNYVWNGKRIRNLGLNLNAPGDRTSPDNTLWIDFPNVGGADPKLNIKIDTIDVKKIRKDPVSLRSSATPWVSSSALVGLRNVEIALSGNNADQETTYTVKLYFSELEERKPGERIFNITLQDKKMLENLDIIAEAGRADSELIKSFSGIKAGSMMKIGLEPVKGNTIISGIELIEEPANITAR